MAPSRLVKPTLRGFHPYTPGLQPPDDGGWVKLNTNESPWPPSLAVLDAIRSAVDGRLRLYPDPRARPARAAIGARHDLAPDRVALGNGADELIEMCFRAFAGAGATVAITWPTYPLFEAVAAYHECDVRRHRLDADLAPPPAFAGDRAPLKFLVNPNSPTGTWLGREAVREVVRRSAGVVVVDEAYVDFAPEDRADLLAEGHENLLILRTFSKSHSLAGMRIGYALGHPDLIEALDLVKDSYNLNRLAIAAAVAAVADAGHHDGLVRFVVAERGWLADRLREKGFEVLPSAANFLFSRPGPGLGAAAVFEGLSARKVLVRRYETEPVAGWLRVTIGTREQHQRLLAALEEVIA